MEAEAATAVSKVAKRARNASSRRSVAARPVLGVALAAQRLIEVDVLLERQRGVEHLFHGIEAVGLDVALDLAGVAAACSMMCALP